MHFLLLFWYCQFQVMEAACVLGRYQKSGAPHKMRKFYTSTTTIERESESEASDSRPPEMLL